MFKFEAMEAVLWLVKHVHFFDSPGISLYKGYQDTCVEDVHYDTIRCSGWGKWNVLHA